MRLRIHENDLSKGKETGKHNYIRSSFLPEVKLPFNNWILILDLLAVASYDLLKQTQNMKAGPGTLVYVCLLGEGTMNCEQQFQWS